MLTQQDLTDLEPTELVLKIKGVSYTLRELTESEYRTYRGLVARMATGFKDGKPVINSNLGELAEIVADNDLFLVATCLQITKETAGILPRKAFRAILRHIKEVHSIPDSDRETEAVMTEEVRKNGGSDGGGISI